MNQSKLLRALVRSWYVVLGLAVLGLVAGIVYANVAPREYTARADVIVAVGAPSAPALSSGSTFAQEQARNLGVLATREQILAPVASSLQLRESAADLSHLITATVPADSSIVTIEATYANAAQATAVANATADSLVQNASTLLSPAGTQRGTVVNIRALHEDVPPTAPSSLSATTAVLFGLGVGLLLGLALVLLIDSIASTFGGARRPRQQSWPAGQASDTAPAEAV